MSGPVQRRARVRATRLAHLGAVAGLLVGWWLSLAPASLGGQATYVLIRGDSMVPELEGGDLVIVRAKESYAIGDVVAYRVPAGEIGAGRLVIHRIIDGDAASGFVLLGDSNPAPDPWHPIGPDIVGAAWLHVPLIGRLVSLIHQPAIAASLAVALIVAALALRWLPTAKPVPASGVPRGA